MPELRATVKQVYLIFRSTLGFSKRWNVFIISRYIHASNILRRPRP
jgi:hypothetical protein